MDDFVRLLFLGFFLLFWVPALFFCLFTFLFTSLVAAPLWKFQGGRERVNTRKQPSPPLTRKPGHDILAIRGDLRRPDLKEKSLPLRTENPLFFSYIIISGHRSMRLKPGRLNAPPAERVSWPGLSPSSCAVDNCNRITANRHSPNRTGLSSGVSPTC